MDCYMTQRYPSLIAGEVHRPVGLGRLDEAALPSVCPCSETGILWRLSLASGTIWCPVASAELHSSIVPVPSTSLGGGRSWRRSGAVGCRNSSMFSSCTRRSSGGPFASIRVHSTSSTNTGCSTRQQTLSHRLNIRIVAVHSSSVDRIFGSRRNSRSTHVGEGPPN